MKLTDAQREQLAALQKEAEVQFDKVLDEKQRAKLTGMGNKNPPGPQGPPGPQVGGPGPPGGGGIFRATRYPADYVGLKGRELKSGQKIGEMVDEVNPNER